MKRFFLNPSLKNLKDMSKIKLSMLFIFFNINNYAQEVMLYERIIKNNENYNFYQYKVLQGEKTLIYLEH
jgi:hypothetical protein